MRVVRAFLIEEQKCVKQVLAERCRRRRSRKKRPRKGRNPSLDQELEFVVSRPVMCDMQAHMLACALACVRSRRAFLRGGACIATMPTKSGDAARSARIR